MSPSKRRFPVRQLIARPLACFTALFMAGILTVLRLAPPGWVSPVGIAFALMLAALLRLRGKRCAVAMLLLGYFLGMGRASLALDAVQPCDTRYSVNMTGQVVSEPYANPVTGRVIVRLRLDSVDGQMESREVRLYMRGDAEPLSKIAYGQRLSLKGHIWRSDPVTNPYEFDFGAYLARNGLSNYATAKIEDIVVESETRGPAALIPKARAAIGHRIDELFPTGAGMVRALVLGDRSMLSDEMRDALNATGTAHLISISGLHVTVLAFALFSVLRPLMKRGWASAATVLALCAYGVLIGFPAPFFRALVMFGVLSFAPVLGVPSDPITRLAAAALLTLTARPLLLEDVSFVLSYGASAGILLLLPPLESLLCLDRLRDRKPEKSRVRRLWARLRLYLPELFCVSLSAQLATLPAVVAFFGVQSLVSLPFNLICVPLCMLGYLFALAALLASAILLPMGVPFALFGEGLFRLLDVVTRLSARLPVTAIRLGRYSGWLVALHMALLLAGSELSALRVNIRRFLPLSLLGLALIASAMTFVRAWPFSVVFLDAGQADCAVVRSRGRTYLIDVGDTYTPVADYLSATCLRLDGIFLSHPHQDHAGGLNDVLAAFKPGAIYVPRGWFDQEGTVAPILEGMALADQMGVEIRELSSGDVIDLSPTARLTVYSPDPERPPESVNDLSLLTLIESDAGTLLFTGDLSSEGEPDVIPSAQVLKVAHHGSSRGTSDRFLKACSPQVAIISVGENNYGHPAEETLEKLERAGAEIYETLNCGAITLTNRGGKWRVDTYLEVPHDLE